MNQELISAIVEEVIRQLMASGKIDLSSSNEGACEDIASPACKAAPLLESPRDAEALERMMKRTTARIGVGRAGPRLKTQTLLALRADHAQARDAVMKDVAPGVLEDAGLFTVQTLCEARYSFTGRKQTYWSMGTDAQRLYQGTSPYSF